MKTVVICGSRRYKKEIYRLADELEKSGIKVYRPYLHNAEPEEWDKLREDHKIFIAEGLTYGHFHKIDKSDIVYIFNKDKYMGVSTTLELGYSIAKNKPVIAYMKDDIEGCRDVLIEKYADNAKDLIKLLDY